MKISLENKITSAITLLEQINVIINPNMFMIRENCRTKIVMRVMIGGVKCRLKDIYFMRIT